jgi:hypothetical protein
MRFRYRSAGLVALVALVGVLVGTCGCGASGVTGNGNVLAHTSTSGDLSTAAAALTPQSTVTSAVTSSTRPSTTEPQNSSASSLTVLVSGTVTRHIDKSSAAGPLSGDETITVEGSMVPSQQPNENGWLRGAIDEGSVSFLGVQEVPSLGNFNATYNGSTSMGDIFVQVAQASTTVTNPFSGPPPLMPWNGGAGAISLECTGTGVAEYQGNTAPMPNEWDTALHFVIWVSSKGEIAIQVTDPNVKSGGLTASYQ